MKISILWPLASSLFALPFYATAQAPQETATIWQVASTPNPGTNNLLLALSGNSASDIWSVGDLVSMHFDGAQWTAFPVVGTNSGSVESTLSGVAELSFSNAWAVGTRFNGATQLSSSMMEHFDGAKWSLVASPHFKHGEVLNAIQAISAKSIYAVGSSSVDNPASMNALLEHFDGSKWSTVALPKIPTGLGISLRQLAVISPSDIWAVGSSGGSVPNQPFAMHFDGTQWMQFPIPTPGAPTVAFLTAVTASASNDVWAVGTFRGSGVVQTTFTVHFDGLAWKVMPSPNADQTDNELLGVSAISTNDVWACGFSAAGFSVLIEHWDGQQWTVSPSPEPNAPSAHAVLALPTGNVFVAGGSLLGPNGTVTSLILDTTQGLR